MNQAQIGSSRLETLLRRVIPGRYRPIGYLTRLVQERTGNCVQAGPFKGMQYVDQSIGSAHLPKLLGCYERELQPAIEQACSWAPTVIINLGAGEGYYTVGLAVRNPAARVIAFEQNPAARRALAQMSSCNGVQSRIEIHGQASPENLEQALGSATEATLPASDARALVLCDVEGDEKVLLDPMNVPDLKRAWLMVELHEFVHRGITDLLLERFAATHRISQIWQQPRSATEFPFRTPGTFLLPRFYLEWAISEWRPELMSWLWMRPHD